MKLKLLFDSEECCVLNTCAHYIRYVKRCCGYSQKLVHGREFFVVVLSVYYSEKLFFNTRIW